MDARRKRQTENELTFRRVNEEIEALAERLTEAGEREPQAWEFVCECHDGECQQRIAMTLREYEAVRAEGRFFFVVPEHVDLAIERVVDMSTRYWIVEKIGEPGKAAEDADPRG